MNFETYKAKLLSFGMIFLILKMAPGGKDRLSRAYKDAFVSGFRTWMDDPAEDFPVIGVTIPLSAERLTTIKRVNLAADPETLMRQAEAVKNEIIAHGKLVNIMVRTYKADKVSLLDIGCVTDFIRDPSGKIVYPFDYWHDCIEVFISKHLYAHSNGKIAKDFKFKTTTSTAVRQRQQVVADMLAETERLIKAASSGHFPPLTLSGTKQPTMINEET